MKHVLTAGSFDIFHKGHETLIKRAFEIGDTIRIGIASDEYIKKTKLHEPYHGYKKRHRMVEEFAIQFHKPFQLFHFDSIYGDAASNKNYTHIVVAKASLPNGKLINLKRDKKLIIEVVDMVYDELNEYPISSERIKAGIIDTDGKVFFSKNNIVDITISKEQRNELQNRIWGKLHPIIKNKCQRAIAVGDATCNKFKKKNLYAYVFDNVVERKPLEADKLFNPPATHKIIKIKNSPATVGSNLQKTIYDNLSHQFALEIDGEEDLATLAFLLEYPLDTSIYYGLPGRGLIELPCTQKWKREAYKLIYGENRS